MAIVSVDNSADNIAIKLGESARVAPEHLMNFLAENEGSSFSPTGILRVPIGNSDVIPMAIDTIERIAGA
jgi:hypothetical protein